MRAAMLEESIALIRRMWSEESVTHRGDYFTVEDARIFDRPDNQVPIVISAFGEKSAKLAARAGDGLWLSSTKEETITAFTEAGGSGPVFSQLTVCWGPDREDAIELAHKVWPNTGLPGQLNQELRTVLDFEQAVELVTPEKLAEEIPCGPEADSIIEKAIEARDRPPDWPDPAKHAHLDLQVEDLERAEKELRALGADKPDFQPGDGWVVLRDPAGHPFCVMPG